MNNRKTIIDQISNRKSFKYKKKFKKPNTYFGKNIFNDSIQKERLPKSIYKQLKNTINNSAPLDPKIANYIAIALKDWAIENETTHYTHWFQPLTGTTAEKHESFLTVNGNPILEFSGKQLIKSEPDASSFPSGGIRQTFEARGYTAWDPTSPVFIMSTSVGKTLFIPSAYISYSGEILDMKTPLIKSMECLSKSSTEILKTLGRKVKQVRSTVGIEQEYFLIDALFYNQRPDLLSSGRTLFGNSPLKGQELADHYFGSINNRVLEFMQDSEIELYKLGIPIKTRHNEVAPNQFEVAPTFETANVAIDHNLLLMSVMKNVAVRHNFRMITHEKPFKGINGSGKHSNWSLVDDKGNNLLDPGKTPRKNLEFITFLAAIIRAIDLHAELLRISVSSLSNDHRLGAHEAPPAIISIYLGDQLSNIIEELVSESFQEKDDTPKHLKLGVSTLPPLPLDNSDRNRTCPFAFTGNKFEFRALGSKQNASSPNFILNTAVAESIDFINVEIKNKLSSGEKLINAINIVLKDIFTKHKRIIYNGDGYSNEWKEEASIRKLPNLETLVDAVPHYTSSKAIKLFNNYNIFSEVEIRSRQNVRYEKFITEIKIEVKSMLEIVRTLIIPVSIKYQLKLAQLVAKMTGELSSRIKHDKGQAKLLEKIDVLINNAINTTDELEEKSGNEFEVFEDHARYLQDNVRPVMTKLRKHVDELEQYIDDSTWPMPKYREILSII